MQLTIRCAKYKIDFGCFGKIYHEMAWRENSGQSPRDGKGARARWKWHGSLGEVKVRYFAWRRAVSRLNVVVHHKNAVVYRDQPRHHKIKLPDHARVRSGRTLGDAIISRITLLSRSAKRRVSALFCLVTTFLVDTTRPDATRRSAGTAGFILRSAAITGTDARRTRDEFHATRASSIEIFVSKHRNLVNGPTSYGQRFIRAFADIVPGHRRDLENERR